MEKEPRISGNVRVIRKFHSRFLENDRDITVLLPSSYDSPETASRRYPVLYLQDGNNLFDPARSFLGVDWGIDETVGSLTSAGRIQDLIVVGIDNTPVRNDEYTPTRDPKHGGGKGLLYGAMLVSELKPFIDRSFRTLPDRQNSFVGGSSLGGLISLYILLRNPDTFCGAIVMSPSFWWADGWIIRWACALKTDWSRFRVWIDIGLGEGDEAIDFVRLFEKTIRDRHPDAAGFSFREFPGAQHNENAWRDRIHLPLGFLLGNPTRNPNP